MPFSNSYSHLGNAFYKRVLPTPVSTPALLLWNHSLAKSLQLSDTLQNDRLLKAQYFSGNQLPDGADSMALAYSGHQFGHLNPQLGDGRAHLLGEVIDKNNKRLDIQLKGSGPTPFSRQGDGRCALGPAIREYMMSEALYYLSVPTSRCLAVVTTGEPVYRETAKPGAIVTRVASSHIRVGTFQYFAIRKDLTSLNLLLDYTIDRHYPELNQSTENKAIALLKNVIEKQIILIVQWMRIGFIHGVMNTDNTAISGETIDFGPCAMMGAYHPGTVYSSIDKQGRYAFGNQANIALWNMTRLAECLLPLINNDEKTAISLVEPHLKQFTEQFESAYFDMLANKLGLSDIEANDAVVIKQLLTLMQDNKLDYTQTFTLLTQSLSDETIAESMKTELGSWYQSWREIVEKPNNNINISKTLMKKNNPVVIPRNHHVEAVLTACEENENSQAADDFLEVLRSPYTPLPNTKNYQDLPLDGDKGYRTFCGT
ncbi:MAG: YdiU family protein [Spongiibacteraceae bacterium]|nr:YdiU family protein [Spongiibacteraceae bacterium]